MLIMLLVLLTPFALAALCIPVWRYQARQDALRRAAHRELQLIHDPMYQAKVERDRAYQLARYKTMHLISANSYIVNAPVQSVFAFPSLKHTEPAALPAAANTVDGDLVTPPALQTIIEELPDNALEFVFGMNPQTGDLARTSLLKAVHIQLVGASGQGKSRQATSILTQLCARNDAQHLNLALIDCEGETTAPFQHLPHVRYLADEPKDAAKTFRGLVNELERRDQVKVLYPVILIFCEEFLNLRRTMPSDYRDQALEDFTTLALRGRKRGMFLFSIGQTAYVDKAIRDAQMQFLSSMAFAVKPTAARSAGFTNSELLNRLYSERRPGQFLLERPTGDSILLAPYVDPGVVPGLLNHCTVLADPPRTEVLASTDVTPVQTPMQAPEPAYDARTLRIRDLVKQGTPQPKIIKEVWGVSNGAAYTKAQQELANILATLLRL
jgi:hypothetical protein